MIEIPKFKVHCSAISQIMTESRAKSKAEILAELDAKIAAEQLKHDGIKDGLKSKANAAEKIERLKSEQAEASKAPDVKPLSQTAKTYCENWLTEILYGRRKEFTSIQTAKGNAVELEAVDFAADVLGWGFTVTQDTSAGNEYIVGKCDVLRREAGIVHDIKSSFDCFTFPLYADQIPDEKYVWQVQGYCNLYGVDRASVVYCLMNIPDEIIKWMCYKEFGQFYTREQFEQLKAHYSYDHLPTWQRIREFEFEYQPELIERVNARVLECRKYINSLVSKLEAGKFYTSND